MSLSSLLFFHTSCTYIKVLQSRDLSTYISVRELQFLLLQLLKIQRCWALPEARRCQFRSGTARPPRDPWWIWPLWQAAVDAFQAPDLLTYYLPHTLLPWAAISDAAVPRNSNQDWEQSPAWRTAVPTADELDQEQCASATASAFGCVTERRLRLWDSRTSLRKATGNQNGPYCLRFSPCLQLHLA